MEMPNAGAQAVRMPVAVDRSLVNPGYIVILVGFAIMMIPLPLTGVIGGLIAGFCGLILGILNLVRGAVTPGVVQIVLGVVGTPIVYAISWVFLIAIAAIADSAGF